MSNLPRLVTRSDKVVMIIYIYIYICIYTTNNNNDDNNFIAIHIIHGDNSSNVEKQNVSPKSTFEAVLLKDIHVKMIYTY